MGKLRSCRRSNPKLSGAFGRLLFCRRHRPLIPRAASIRKKKTKRLDIICFKHKHNSSHLRDIDKMPFAQLVIGPPGAGKSTYCNGMHQFLGAIGRKCSVVNLDPANDKTSYPCALDVRDLVTLEDIMEEDKLGPNGGVLYALEELENNFDWLENGLKELGGMSDISPDHIHLLTGFDEFSDDYILFDCPGQVELFTHHASLRNIFYKIQKMGIRVSCSRTSSTAQRRPS